MAHLQIKTLCNQHNIHNLRVVEALVFLGIYGKSKNSQFFGTQLGGRGAKCVANKIVAEG
jgi:hypothetical protein